MFNTPCEIHRRYDLKGSWVGRVTAAEKRDPHVALKDVDFQQANEKISLGEERSRWMLSQIRRDSVEPREFYNIMIRNMIKTSEYSYSCPFIEVSSLQRITSSTTPCSWAFMRRRHRA